MIVFKTFLKYVKANIFSFIIYIIMAIAIVFTNMNSYNINTSKDMEIRKMDIIVNDKSNDEFSVKLVNYLKKNNNIEYTDMDEIDLRDKIFIENLSGGIIIEKDFKENIINNKKSMTLIGDISQYDSNNIYLEVNKLIKLLNGSYIDGKIDETLIDGALENETKINFQISEDEIQELRNEYLSFYFNFLGYVIIVILTGVFGSIMSIFNSDNIRMRNVISSTKMTSYDLNILLSQGIISIFLIFLLVLVGLYSYTDMTLKSYIIKYIVNIYVYGFSILSFVYLINNITNDSSIKSMISIMFSLGISFISGVMVNLSLVPDLGIKIARFFPTYYYVLGNNTYGGVSNIYKELFTQFSFGLVFIFLGLLINKTKRKDSLDMEIKK